MSSLPVVLWQCPPTTVLVAVDFGDASARALAIGGVVASAFGARLRALHAERFEPPPYFTLDQIAGLEAERRVTQAAATDHLARFAAEASGYRVESLVRDEPPVEAILNSAATADLIIAGTHAPGAWTLVAGFGGRAGRTRSHDSRSRHACGGHASARGLRAHCVRAGRRKCRVGCTHLRRAPRDHCGRHPHGRRTGHPVRGRCHAAGFAGGHGDQGDRPSWGITNSVATVLAACQRPVLFIPARGTHL